MPLGMVTPMLRKSFLRLRRAALKLLVPESVWPRSVQVGTVEVAVRGAPYSFGIKRLLSRDPDSYERAERTFLSHLKPTDHVIEYGSSIGILTALICEQVPQGKVISVEASSSLIEYSRTWLSRYPQLTQVHAAAFPINDRIELNFSFDDADGSLGGMVSYDKSGSNASGTSTFFVSDARKVEGFQPTVLVVDIEGSEDIILTEPMNLPDTIDRFIIELHSFIYGRETEQSIIARIEQQGFTLVDRVESVHFFTREKA
jgi:FkbM family methyltransferase